MIKINKITKIIVLINTILLTTIGCEKDNTIKLREYKKQLCYDGDTCYITYKGEQKRLRIRGMDAPEMNTIEGLISKKYLIKILKEAKEIKYTNIGTDKYQRVLADIYIDGRKVSEIMIHSGKARRWN